MAWRYCGSVSRLDLWRWDALKPPYVIIVVNAINLAPEVREMVHDFSSAIAETRARRAARIGEDVAVRLDIEN